MLKSKSAHRSKKQKKVKEEDKDEIPALEVSMTYKQIQEATCKSTNLQGKSTRYHLGRLPWRQFFPTKFCCIQSQRFVHFLSGPFCILFWFISKTMVQPPEGGSYWLAKIIELCSTGQSDNLMVTDVFHYISWYLFINNQQVFAFVHWFYTINDIPDLCAQRPAQKRIGTLFTTICSSHSLTWSTRLVDYLASCCQTTIKLLKSPA